MAVCKCVYGTAAVRYGERYRRSFTKHGVDRRPHLVVRQNAHRVQEVLIVREVADTQQPPRIPVRRQDAVMAVNNHDP
jgi:hypothetical protein